MIVVDASVAIKWIFQEEHTDQAKALFRDSLHRREAIIAPPLLLNEVTNTLRQRMRGTPPLPRDDALALLDDFLTFPIQLDAPSELHRQALMLADDFDLPAVYDAQYLALAQTHGCNLWTADQRFLRQLRGRLPFVHWIGDYAS